MSTWNITALQEDDIDITNRTNNPLERYNRRINEAFPVAHPNLLQFVHVIRDEAKRYCQMIENIKKGIETSPKHERSYNIEIPSLFKTFKTSLDKCDSSNPEDSVTDSESSIEEKNSITAMVVPEEELKKNLKVMCEFELKGGFFRYFEGEIKTVYAREGTCRIFFVEDHTTSVKRNKNIFYLNKTLINDYIREK